MKMKMKYLFLTITMLVITGIAHAQLSRNITIEWGAPAPVTMGYENSVQAPWFKGAQYLQLPENILPAFTGIFPLPDGSTTITAEISNPVYTAFTQEEEFLLQSTEIQDTYEPGVSLMSERGKPRAVVTLLPFGTDPATGRVAKLTSFTIVIHYQQGSLREKNQHTYAQNSVLSTGDWYKVYIKDDGIYKLTFDDLKNLGINMTGLDPAKIRIFGNGGHLLNEAAGTPRIDDLAENAIRVVTATPGVFAQGDYILFYGEGTTKWTMNPFSGRMDHVSHYYADEACYLINVGLANGKRVQSITPPDGEPNTYSIAWTAYALHENDAYSLIKSGKKWYGEKLDYYNRTFNLPAYSFPDMVMTEPVSVRYGFAGRATSQLSYNILVNNEIIATNTMSGITGSNDFARELATSATFTPQTSNLQVQVKFNPPNTTALGWLDFVSINARCNLRFSGGQMSFRDPRTVGPGKITSFTMGNAVEGLELWDVSDPTNAGSVQLNRVGDQYTFKCKTDTLNELVAFDGTSFYSVTPGGKINNQNLHATGNYDMIIVTHPDFAQQAQRLAMIHNDRGDVSTTVVSLPEIYNEFSSGIQDITAIRDFMKMLYDRGAGTGQPQYLLLFGNASYDVKDRITDNSCFIPSFQSENSIRPVASFLSDDYFGLLDDGEGANQTTGLLDVASGRLPVRTQEQANTVVDKIEHYLKNPDSTQGDWRNTLIVIADDQNKNLHLEQAENLTERIQAAHPVYNVEKIYFDAYKQLTTPGGSRYPDVNREIVTRVEKGALLTNYIGHGGEVGWADERVLEIADINSWVNYERMGIFFTATCEFSRFDNPAHTSAGELVFLNPEGGAMSMITTTRLAFASYNAALNLSFIDTMLNATDGVYPRMGDILRYTKNDNVLSANNRHMTLFGDPSIHLPYPEHSIVTTSVSSDTLFANTLATVEGEVQDMNGNLITGFNGILSVKVFDKPSKVSTLGQDSDSYAIDFMTQKSILYQGKASVEGGKFSFTFPVPRDIDYNFGKGKISYYATDGTEDAHGYYDDIIIGGSANQSGLDKIGPEIRLFINDTTFVNGDFTSENPKLLAFLHDENGINTAGNGIGHDIVATIDGDNYTSVLLNDYYSADLDSYQSGLVNYKYFNLAEGEHTLTLKAWDVFNNSSSASITFNVKRNIILDVNEVKAYPNPSAGDVWYSFGHNQFDGEFTVELNIYSITGELIRTIGPLKVASESYIAGNIKWDGRSFNGSYSRNGLYLCRLKVRDRNNYTVSNTVKVILQK